MAGCFEGRGNGYPVNYIQPPEDMHRRAEAYVGKNVRTTDESYGRVTDAYVRRRVVHLLCVREDGTVFRTDNEHSTIWEPR